MSGPGAGQAERRRSNCPAVDVGGRAVRSTHGHDASLTTRQPDTRALAGAHLYRAHVHASQAVCRRFGCSCLGLGRWSQPPADRDWVSPAVTRLSAAASAAGSLVLAAVSGRAGRLYILVCRRRHVCGVGGIVAAVSGRAGRRAWCGGRCWRAAGRGRRRALRPSRRASSSSFPRALPRPLPLRIDDRQSPPAACATAPPREAPARPAARAAPALRGP